MHPGSTASVELRDAEPADEPFLRDVYASTRADELAVVPWTDEQKRLFTDHQFHAQDVYYKEHYEGATYDVVLVDGEAAGRLYVARWATEIRIMDIALLPAARGGGVGTHLLESLLEEGAATGRRVSIHVERMNPAMRLYERLGFHPIEERGVYVLMEWDPPT